MNPIKITILTLAISLCAQSNLLIAGIDSEFDTAMISIPFTPVNIDSMGLALDNFSLNNVENVLFCEYKKELYLNGAWTLPIRSAKEGLKDFQTYLQYPQAHDYFAKRCAQTNSKEELSKMLTRCKTKLPLEYVKSYLETVKSIVSTAIKKQEDDEEPTTTASCSTQTPIQSSKHHDLEQRINLIEQWFTVWAGNETTQHIIAKRLAESNPEKLTKLASLAQSDISPNEEYNQCVKSIIDAALAEKD